MRYASDLVQTLERDRRVEAYIAGKAFGTLDAGGDLFRLGQAALLAAIDESTLLGKLDIAVIPLGPPAVPMVGTLPLAYVVTEGSVKPEAVLAFTTPDGPTKIAGLVILSTEFFRALSPENAVLIRRLLVSATARRTDEWVIATLTAAAPTSVTGATVLMRAGELLGALDTAARPALLIGLTEAPLVATAIAGLAETGIRVIATAAANGTIIAVDLAGLAAGSTAPEVVIARQGTCTLGGVPTNLFQASLLALRVERFGRLAIAAGAVAHAAAT